MFVFVLAEVSSYLKHKMNNLYTELNEEYLCELQANLSDLT